MAKQRFVVYKSFNKDGEHMRSLQVIGGKYMSFLSGLDFKEDLKRRTYAMRDGACRFKKIIHFN